MVKNIGAKREGLFSVGGERKAELLLLLRQQREMFAARGKGREICLNDCRPVGERKKRNWFQERWGSSR